jgi:hypothetical protein
MFARRKRRRMEDKAMPIVSSALSLVDVGPKLIRRRRRCKTIINEQLNLNAGVRLGFIYRPTRN